MRKLIIAASALAPVLLAAAPASAQSYPDPRDREIVRSLPDPRQIEELGDTLGRVAEALMDVPIGPIADAIDPYRRGRDRNETLGDVASRGDPYARERIRDQVGAATVGVSAAAEQLAVLTPVLRRSLEDATRRMEDAMAGRGRGRDYDRDRGYERDREYDGDGDYERDDRRPR
jgi:hypothetical protein